MDTPTIATTLLIVAATAYYWGGVLAVRLPEIDSRFDRKPFNCRPCLTFHLTAMPALLLALVSQSIALMMSGIVVAFAVFGIAKFMDNKMIEK